MSPIGVGILDKVDGVGTCPGILLHLEVVCWKSKGSEDKVPQVLQLTCNVLDKCFTFLYINGATFNIKIHKQNNELPLTKHLLF